MNPVAGAYVFPHTDYVDVTCNAAANAKCNSWTIKSNGSKGGCLTADCSVKQNVARLSKMVTARGRTTAISQGDFYLTFSIGVTNP
jgi:hypothetical protein